MLCCPDSFMAAVRCLMSYVFVLQPLNASAGSIYVQRMTAVLREYERRSGLAQEMLQALQSGREREKGVDDMLQRLKMCASLFSM